MNDQPVIKMHADARPADAMQLQFGVTAVAGYSVAEDGSLIGLVLRTEQGADLVLAFNDGNLDLMKQALDEATKAREAIAGVPFALNLRPVKDFTTFPAQKGFIALAFDAKLASRVGFLLPTADARAIALQLAEAARAEPLKQVRAQILK